MFSRYLSSIEGISVFAIIGLIIFFGVFAVMILWVAKLDKKYIARMGNLPLDEEHVASDKSENFNNAETKNEIK